MKSAFFIILGMAFTSAKAAEVQGFDISNWQSDVDFGAAYASGARFVVIKATEGTDFIDKRFPDHYEGATKAGFIRGGYHFAHPDLSAEDQVDFFVEHGGGWSNDGITLPGMLDLENEGGYPACWGISNSAMVSWIKAFSDRYYSNTTRYPMLYTSPSWWKDCTGNSTAFNSTNALVLARWGSSVGSIPGGWTSQTIWQNLDEYAYGGDSDIFNGSLDELKRFATG